MQFDETPLKGAFVIHLDKIGDERGFFARLFCEKEFEYHGLDNRILQANNSFSAEMGTLRGLHYQLAPMAETKIVRCIKGSLYDVIVDLREDSKTFGQWFAVELTEENRTMLYIPKGFAHGFLTLSDDSEILYLTSQYYSPKHERGIRWDDPYFSIDWPFTPRVLSTRDSEHPNFCSGHHLAGVT